MPQAIPVSTVDKYQKKSNDEEVKEEKEEEEKVQKMENEVKNAIFNNKPNRIYCVARRCCCSRGVPAATLRRSLFGKWTEVGIVHRLRTS